VRIERATMARLFCLDEARSFLILGMAMVLISLGFRMMPQYFHMSS